MKAFRINGTYRDTRNDQVFSVETVAEDADGAREKALSTLGSRHKLKRWEIDIAEVRELQASEVTDATVRYEIGEE